MTRRALLAAVVAAVAMLGTAPALTRPPAFRGGHPSGGGADVMLSGVTTTIKNDAGSSSGIVPHTFGMIWKRGEVSGCLTTNYPVPKDADGTERSFQLDDMSTWDDGSCRHASVSRFMPSISAGGTHQVQWYRRPGAYTPGTNPRTTADITGAHDFKMEYTDVRPCAYTFVTTVSNGDCHYEDGVLGTGAFTASLNQMIADGIVQVVATGPVRLGLVVHGAAIDASPTATTVTGALTSGTTGPVTVASTAGFAVTGTEMGKIDGEYVLVSRVDGTTLNLMARGAGGSTAASHSGGATVTKVAGSGTAHLWNRWYVDVYTDPSNPAAVFGISYLPLTMQPWLNIVGADSTSYFAALKDGASTVRDWATSVSVTQNTTNIDLTADTITLGSNPFIEGECVSPSSTGTLPAGQVANRPYWTRPATTGQSNYRFWPDVAGGAVGLSTGDPQVDITDVGSGTITLTRRICTPYREGWYSTADDAGNQNWTVTRPQLRSQLTTPERTYWQAAGMMPPYDLAISANALVATMGNGSSAGDTRLYRPGAAISTSNPTGQGSTTANQGILPDAPRVAWLRQDATHWGYAMASGLGKMHYAWVGLLNERTGKIPALNNGPDAVGGSYPVLGAPNPTLFVAMSVVGSASSVGITPVPGTTATNNNNSSGAIFGTGGSGSNANAHRTHDPYFPWLITGLRAFLDTVYMDGNAVVANTATTPNIANATGRIKQIGGTGRTYYATFIFGNDARTPTALKTMISASVMGSSSNPEKGLMQDYLTDNLDFWEAMQAVQPAGQNNIGAMDVNTQGGDGLTTRWQSGAWLWGYGLTRDPRFADLINRVTNYQKECYTGGWVSSYYCGAEYHTNFTNPWQAALIQNTWNGSWVTNFTTTFSDVGFGSFGNGNFELEFVGGGSANGFTGDGYRNLTISDNDPVMLTDPIFRSSPPGTAYGGPPEFKPDAVTNACGGNRWFYIRNPVQTTAGSLWPITFDGLACTPGGSVIPVATSTVGPGTAWAMRPQANPSTGMFHGYSNNPDTYSAQDRMILCWARALGTRSDLDAAITDVNFRTGLTAASFSSQAIYGMDCNHPTIQ